MGTEKARCTRCGKRRRFEHSTFSRICKVCDPDGAIARELRGEAPPACLVHEDCRAQHPDIGRACLAAQKKDFPPDHSPKETP